MRLAAVRWRGPGVRLPHARMLRGCKEVLVKRRRRRRSWKEWREKKRSGAPYFASTFVGNTITQAHRSIPGSTMISPFSSWWSG